MRQNANVGRAINKVKLNRYLVFIVQGGFAESNVVERWNERKRRQKKEDKERKKQKKTAGGFIAPPRSVFEKRG